MTHPVVVVGSYNQDFVWRVDRFAQPGETRRGLDFSTGPGGKGFNQAVACARQGVATRFIAALGEDSVAESARARAIDEGLDGVWLTCPSYPTGTACILVDASGQNSIVVTLGANEQLDAQQVRSDVGIAAASVVLCQLETNVDAVRAAFAASSREALRLLNPAPVHLQLDAALLEQADVLTPNETEFAELLRKCHRIDIAASGLADCDDAQLHSLCRRLPGSASVVLTLGARGCFVSHAPPQLRGDDTAFYRVPSESVTPRDTTGAGDAFNGGLAAALCRFRDAPFRRQVMHANRVAALSTEQPGAALAMPTSAQVRARFGE